LSCAAPFSHRQWTNSAWILQLAYFGLIMLQSVAPFSLHRWKTSACILWMEIVLQSVLLPF
jgi:hypothetical protein